MRRSRKLWTTPLSKEPGTVRVFCIDATERLVVGTETLTGTPTVTATPSGLTIATVAVNSGVFTEPSTGNTVAANQGVTFKATGGKLGDKFELKTTVDLSATGETLELWTLFTIE